MNTTGYRLLAIAVGLAASVSTIAMAQAQGVIGNLAKNDSIFVDGKTFNVITGRSKADTDVRKLGARELGPGAIIFRSEDKLYISDASERVAAYLNDPDIERQRPLGLRDADIERQRALGLRDTYIERHRALGLRADVDVERQRPLGLRDADIEQQRALGLRDTDIERQRALGLRDADIERQRALGLRDADIERQRALGLSDVDIERQRAFGLREAGVAGRYRVYINDPDYAYYRLKKAFEENWTTNVAK